MKAVFKHELSNYFHSLTAYIFGAFLLVFVGIGAMIYNIQQAVANFEYVLSFVSLVFVVLIPVLTMRVIAEERKQKTDQLLYSLPITTTQIVVGKYLAMLVVFLVPLCMIGIYPMVFAVRRGLSPDFLRFHRCLFYHGGGADRNRYIYIFPDGESGICGRDCYTSHFTELLQCQSGGICLCNCVWFSCGTVRALLSAGGYHTVYDQK